MVKAACYRKSLSLFVHEYTQKVCKPLFEENGFYIEIKHSWCVCGKEADEQANSQRCSLDSQNKAEQKAHSRLQ